MTTTHRLIGSPGACRMQSPIVSASTCAECNKIIIIITPYHVVQPYVCDLFSPTREELLDTGVHS